MALKRHHKIMIGGFSFFITVLIILLAIMNYTLYLQETQHYNALKDAVSALQSNTQTQINSLSSNLLGLQNSTQNTEQQINLLKAGSGNDFSGIYQAALPSVVIVKTDSGLGTGFFITPEGFIVTNAHVLADQYGNLASNIRIVTDNQNTISAQFIGYDPSLDIAVLKIPGQYTPLKLGNSNSIQPGDQVIAIGTPYGLDFSISNGVVSGVNRQGPNGINGYIQHTALLNPGNSGGPLINKNGEVIGINNFKYSSGEGLGFALESNYIKQSINNIAMQNLNSTLINY